MHSTIPPSVLAIKGIQEQQEIINEPISRHGMQQENKD
jgi:hypothetical protein